MIMLRGRVSTLLAAAVLAFYVVDSFILNQGVLALVVAAAAVAVGVLLCLWTALKDRERLVRRATTLAMYVLLPVAVGLTNHLNESIARRRAESLIAACNRFKHRYGAFPDSLDRLVPEFIPRVPRAKLGLLFNRFDYYASSSRHRLQWVSFPPYVRTYFVLEEARWGVMED